MTRSAGRSGRSKGARSSIQNRRLSTSGSVRASFSSFARKGVGRPFDGTAATFAIISTISTIGRRVRDQGAGPVLDRRTSWKRDGIELRQLVEKRRSAGKRLVLAAASFGLALVSANVWWPTPVLFVWNASPSVPVGLYRLTGGPVRNGDMVVARMPPAIRGIADRRHYLPSPVPLVKRVAAVAGDRLCAAGARIFVNGVKVAVRLRTDPAGRRMPWWEGCQTLSPGEFFLLAPARLSFDGRYFGVSRKSEILGRAKLLWAA